jgi:hypothetical protein
VRRGVASAVVLAAVALVAVAAIVDAVRQRPAPPLDAEAAGELAELGVSGTLVYTDPGCRLRAVSLPDLRPAPLPAGETRCDISVSPDGRRVASASVRWSADGTRRARCGGICAWHGHELTVARNGGIFGEDGRPLVPRSEVVSAALSASGDTQRRLSYVKVLDLAWTSPNEVVALVNVRYSTLRGTQLVAGFQHGRLVWQQARARRLERLVPGPQGRLAAEPADLVRADFRLPEEVELGGALDWSPRGLWLVLGSRGRVIVYDPRYGRIVSIPVTARDLAWR